MDTSAAAIVAAMRTDPDAPRHALDLLRQTGLRSGTLYPVLVRLERSGLVTSHARHTGRRVYLLTPDGVAALDGAPPPAAHSAGRAVTVAGRAVTVAGRAVTVAGRAVEALLPVGSARRAVAMWLPAAVIGGVEAYAALSRPAAARLTDLGVYLGAARGLRHGTSLYDFISGHAPFTYPPFAGLLFAPLTFAATLPVQFAWTLGTLLAVAVLSVLAARATRAAVPSVPATRAAVPSVPPGRAARAAALAGGSRDRWAPAAPALAAVLVASAPVSSDLKYGQVSLVLAALVAVDVLALHRTRGHGLLIGVAAAVKLTPLIFVPVLWCAGRRRAAALAAGAFAACGALGWAVLPGDSWRYWGTEVFDVHRLGFITSVGNQSLDGALMRAGIAEPGRSLPVLAVAAIVAVLALRRAAHAYRAGDRLTAMTLAGAASIVVSPVSWTHHQVWLVLAASLPVAGTARARRAWVAVVLGVMLLAVTALGPPLWSNARLLLAVAVACVVPLRAGATAPPASPASCRSAPPKIPDRGDLRPYSAASNHHPGS